MKKVVAIFIMAALLLCCAGCSRAYDDQAPTLYITLGDRVIEVKGMMEAYAQKRLFLFEEAQIFCGPSAPECDVIPIDFKGDRISFLFDEKPKAMWMYCYKDGDAEAMKIESKGEEWLLQKGKGRYELFATWENAVSRRIARYVFCIDSKI